MRRALELARLGIGRTHPNPLVGAVVVADGRIVGEGAHLRAGGAHAEVDTLGRAGEAARGADLYVTLEPCNHHGRTAPCTRAILDAGIRRVYFAVADPNPDVAGGGADFLRSRGVDCTEGPLTDEAAYMNRGFFRWTLTNTPWVIAKFAAGLDGRIATRTGESKWITGNASRVRAHELRREVDAILVGSGTILADDPRLTARVGEPEARHVSDSLSDGAGGTPALRVVLDSRGRSPLDATVFTTTPTARTLVATTAGSPAEWRQRLLDNGVDVALLPAGSNGRVGVDALLSDLGVRGVRSMLVEGGATVHGAFFDARRVDEVWAFVAPLIIGGEGARPAVGGVGAAALNDAVRLGDVQMERCGDDILIRGVLSSPVSAPPIESEVTCSQVS